MYIIFVDFYLIYNALWILENINLRPAFDEISSVIDWDAITTRLEDVNVIACINKHDPKIIPYLNGNEYASIHNFIWTHPQYLKVSSVN